MTIDNNQQENIAPCEGFTPLSKPLKHKKFPHPPSGSSHVLPATVENLEYMLRSYGVKVHYNTIKKKVEIQLPDQTPVLDNNDNVALTHIISLAALNGMPVMQVPAYVELLAHNHPYNPVALWIESKPWDGHDRIPEILETIQTQEDFSVHLKQFLIYRWLLSCVAAAFKESDFKARGVLTLQGPQGCGKTSWVTSLVPDSVLRASVVKVDHHLDGNNKDSILTAITHWIVEIGELDSSFKKDVARLKGFLTSDQDKLRRPYARGDSEYARRTVFCATVNASGFLVDLTGNTRWWTIPVESVNYAHGIDMQQLFAQLLLDFKKGEPWWLNYHEEALLELHNRDHLTDSTIRELLLDFIDMDLKQQPNNPYMSATEVLQRLGFKNISNGLCRECGAHLRDLLGTPKKVKGNAKWRVPVKRDEGTRREFPGLREELY